MSLLQSILLFIVEVLRDRWWVSGMAMVAGGKTDWLWGTRCHDPRILWGYSDLSDAAFWSRICCLWRRLHCGVLTLGLGNRWDEAGSL